MADQFVNAVDPDGKPVKLPAQNAGAAFKDGFRPESADETKSREEEAKFGDRPVAAFAAGAGRGATLGLSDVALTKTGLVDPETLKGLQEHNQGASIAGDVAGTVLPALIPGIGEASAGGLAARLGAGAEGFAAKTLGEGAASLAGKVVAKAAGAATEGAVFGLGSAVSEDVLEDGNLDLAGEKLLSHVGLGAVLGAGLGGAGPLFDSALSRAGRGLKRFIPEDLSGMLREKAEGSAARSLNGTAGDYAGLNDRVNPIGRELLDRDLVGANWRDINVARQGEGKKIGSLLEAADKQLGEKQFNLGKFVDRAKEEVLGQIGDDPALAGDAAEVEKLINGYAAKAEDRIGFAEANRLKTNLSKKVNFKVDGDVKKEWVAKLGGILDDEIETQLGSALGDEGVSAFQASKQSYGNLKEATKIARKAERRGAGNRAFGLTDNMWAIGAAMTGNVGALGHVALGAGAGLANKFARENGQGLIARALDAIADHPVLEKVAQGLQQTVKNAAPDAFGPFTNVLLQASSKGANDLLATHVALAQSDPAYRDTMAKAGLMDSSPSAEHETINKAADLAAISRATAKQDTATQEAVDGFLKGGGKAPNTPPMSAQEFKTKSDELSGLVTNPQALIKKLQAGPMLAGAAPGVAAAMAATASRAVQFLYDKAPKNPYPPAIPGMERTWQPPDADLSKWARYSEAVNNPQSVLENMRRGTVTQEAVEALRAVYPQLAQDVQSKLVASLSDGKRTLSYRQKMAVATLMGRDLEPTMAPQAVAAFQQYHAAAQAQEQQRPPTTGQRIRVQDMATTSQRIEGKK